MKKVLEHKYSLSDIRSAIIRTIVKRQYNKGVKSKVMYSRSFLMIQDDTSFVREFSKELPGEIEIKAGTATWYNPKIILTCQN